MDTICDPLAEQKAQSMNVPKSKSLGWEEEKHSLQGDGSSEYCREVSGKWVPTKCIPAPFSPCPLLKPIPVSANSRLRPELGKSPGPAIYLKHSLPSQIFPFPHLLDGNNHPKLLHQPLKGFMRRTADQWEKICQNSHQWSRNRTKTSVAMSSMSRVFVHR